MVRGQSDPRVSNPSGNRRRRRRWRDYTTASGNRPVRQFILSLPSVDRAALLAAMDEVAVLGLEAARHVRGEVYEVRAFGENRAFRVLFAEEGRYGQVLLALEGFVKKSQGTPKDEIELALDRLRDWRERGRRPET